VNVILLCGRFAARQSKNVCTASVSARARSSGVSARKYATIEGRSTFFRLSGASPESIISCAWLWAVASLSAFVGVAVVRGFSSRIGELDVLSADFSQGASPTAGQTAAPTSTTRVNVLMKAPSKYFMLKLLP
jgi:hypothetical protein